MRSRPAMIYQGGLRTRTAPHKQYSFILAQKIAESYDTAFISANLGGSKAPEKQNPTWSRCNKIEITQPRILRKKYLYSLVFIINLTAPEVPGLHEVQQYDSSK